MGEAAFKEHQPKPPPFVKLRGFSGNLRYTVVEPRFAKTGFHSVQKARGDTELTQGQGQVDTLEKAEKSDFCLLYLEDHPSGCKWLGSPPFVSHLAHLEGE